MKKLGKTELKGVGLIGIISILTIVVFMSGCTSLGMSESDYKAACKEVPVNELLNNLKNTLERKLRFLAISH